MERIMKLQDFLPSENVVVGMQASSKEQLIRLLSDMASKKCGLAAGMISKGLLERERLGSTGIGEGIAIPHARFEDLQEIVCLCAKLSRPVDFDAMDGLPVDVVILLLSPSNAGREGLNILSCVARRFRDERVLPAICQAGSAEEVYAILTS
jgi:PTS system nitrogen regulatory IIA component